MDRVIISVATTGSWTTRAHTPYMPITEEERLLLKLSVAGVRELRLSTSMCVTKTVG